MMKVRLLILMSVFIIPAFMYANNPKVYFIEPTDGSEVARTFKVKFGLENFGVAPAGYDAPNTGHHHLLVDTAITDFTVPIPADANHIHFGKGQTEATITLESGAHELTLVLGNFAHIPHPTPIVSETITVLVK